MRAPGRPPPLECELRPRVRPRLGRCPLSTSRRPGPAPRVRAEIDADHAAASRHGLVRVDSCLIRTASRSSPPDRAPIKESERRRPFTTRDASRYCDASTRPPVSTSSSTTSRVDDRRCGSGSMARAALERRAVSLRTDSSPLQDPATRSATAGPSLPNAADDSAFSARHARSMRHQPQRGAAEHHDARWNRFQAAAKAETLGACRSAGATRTGLVGADGPPRAFQRFQCAGIAAHLPTVGDDAPGTQDIVRVRGPRARLGALDEVRETGFGRPASNGPPAPIGRIPAREREIRSTLTTSDGTAPAWVDERSPRVRVPRRGFRRRFTASSPERRIRVSSRASISARPMRATSPPRARDGRMRIRRERAGRASRSHPVA